MEYLEWLKLKFHGAKRMMYKRDTNTRHKIDDARRHSFVLEHCQSQ